MAMVVCESVVVSLDVCKVAKGDQLGWRSAGWPGWRGAGTHVWRRGQVRFSLAAGRGEGRRLRLQACDQAK